eukprot:535155_1
MKNTTKPTYLIANTKHQKTQPNILEEEEEEEKYTQQIRLKINVNNKHKSQEKEERKHNPDNNRATTIELVTFASVSLNGSDYDNNLDKLKSIKYNINKLENKIVVNNYDNNFNESEIDLQERINLCLYWK